MPVMRISGNLTQPDEELMGKLELMPEWEKAGDSTREEYWRRNGDRVGQKLSAFPKFVDRTSLSRFLVKNEIFNRIRPIQGSIVECGVRYGGGLFTWANLSALYEPLNHRRRVIGFDTFEGFPSVAVQDRPDEVKRATVGGVSGGSIEDIQQAIMIFDEDRPLGNIPKIEVIKGNFMHTAGHYLADNQHLVVSLLYLDFDIYEPTKKALEVFLPRMPKGAVVAFDEIHCEEWPGETIALQEVAGISNVRLERMPFSSISWWQIP
jgi:hypothetical protein